MADILNPATRRERSCPRCGERLRRWAVGSVEAEGCDVCGGVWFDGRELTAVTRVEGRPLEALEAEFTPGLAADAGGGKMTCPACRQPLEPFEFPHARGIQLDGCQQCGGIWVDNGELEQLAGKLPRDLRPARSAPATVREDRVALAVGVLRRRECPACGAGNAESARRCAGCGVDLLRRPEQAAEPEHVYGPSVGYLAREFILLVAIGYLFVAGVPMRRTDNLQFVPDAYQWWSLLPLVAVFAWNWIWRKLRVEVGADGIRIRYPLWQRWIPWDAVVSGAVFDLGSRSVLGPVSDALGTLSRSRMSSMRRSWEELRETQDTPGRARLYLRTTRGMVSFGPELSRHFDLLDRIRARMG